MKRGEVSSYYIVVIILAVMGFIVVLWFLYGFDFSGFSEEETCRLSVLTRATSPELAQSAVPLKCETKKICLTARGGGECSSNLAGENPEVIKLPRGESDMADEIARVSADEMLNCWKLMGEGKLDLFGKFDEQLGLDVAKPTCVVCSRIAVDESVERDVLERVDINRYMRENEVKGLGRNYIYAFTSGGVVSHTSQNLTTESVFKEFSDEEKVKDSQGNEIKLRGNSENRELAIVFTQFIPPPTEDVLDNMLRFGGTVAGATFFSPAGGHVIRFVVANPITSGLAAIGVAGAVGGYGAYNSYQGQLAAAGYCGKFATNREDAEGCSMVQGVNYRAEDINALCPQIQGRL